jgi:aminoglycoside phosphotransferase (APT) family kinase protein
MSTHVKHLLGAATYAASVHVVQAGAAHRGGLFYAFGEGFEHSLFEALEKRLDQVAPVVDQVATNLRPWTKSPVPVSMTVGEIRNLVIDDSTLSTIAPAPEWVKPELEAGLVQARRCRAHGDLHGGNVLLDRRGYGLLIDFGRADFATAPLDPVTLEVSAILHPDSNVDRGGWPSTEQAFDWVDADAYLEGCPPPEWRLSP